MNEDVYVPIKLYSQKQAKAGFGQWVIVGSLLHNIEVVKTGLSNKLNFISLPLQFLKSKII